MHVIHRNLGGSHNQMRPFPLWSNNLPYDFPDHQKDDTSDIYVRVKSINEKQNKNLKREREVHTFLINRWRTVRPGTLQADLVQCTPTHCSTIIIIKSKIMGHSHRHLLLQTRDFN